jgi:hypothetical protein
MEAQLTFCLPHAVVRVDVPEDVKTCSQRTESRTQRLTSHVREAANQIERFEFTVKKVKG